MAKAQRGTGLRSMFAWVDERNRREKASFVCGGVAAVLVAGWTLFTHFENRKAESKPQGLLTDTRPETRMEVSFDICIHDYEPEPASEASIAKSADKAEADKLRNEVAKIRAKNAKSAAMCGDGPLRARNEKEATRLANERCASFQVVRPFYDQQPLVEKIHVKCVVSSK